MDTRLNTLVRTLLTCLCILSFGAQADDSEIAGYVKTIRGSASIESSGRSSAISEGSAVRLGDRLRTGADASIGLTLKDNTMLSIGPNSELSIDEFVFSPATDQLGLSARLFSGTLHFISGVIAKLRPSAVRIVTPTATIGVRGTRFVVKTDE